MFYRQIEIVNHKVDGGPSRKIVNHKAVWGAMLLHGLHDPHAASAQDPRWARGFGHEPCMLVH